MSIKQLQRVGSVPGGAEPPRGAGKGMVEDSDPQVWVEAMARGDEQGLIALYRAYSQDTYAFILRRTGSSADAEELVPEVFYEAFKSAARFERRSSVLTWILSIAKYRSIDRLRQQGDRTYVEIDDQVLQIADESPDAIDRLAARQTREQIERCMRELPIEQRDCVQLALHHDLPYSEIGAIVGCPESTVKTRVFHAKRKLAQCFKRCMGESR